MLETLTTEQYEAVKKAICPYCAVGMTNTLHSEVGFYHTIPGYPKNLRFDCLADSFRKKRADAVNAYKHTDYAGRQEAAVTGMERISSPG